MTHPAWIYMDNNATAPVAEEVVAAMTMCLAECYGNPSSQHKAGAAAKQMVLEARAKVAVLLGATLAEIVFTSGATESNHLAILGALARDPSRRHVVVSAVEHPSTRLLLARLIREGVSVTEIAVDSDGLPDLDALRAAVTPQTALVSMMWVNNETGVVLPVAQAAAIAAECGVPFHTDAVQAVGRLPIQLGQLPIDMLSFSGHKLHAAKGIGVLFVRKGFKLPALLSGHQERGRRGGTENVASIVGLGVAAEQAMIRLEVDGQRIRGMRDYLEQKIAQTLPFAQVNSGNVARVANTSNMRFGLINAEIVLDRLDKSGICVSSGSACTAGGTEPSHVLLAMGQSPDQALAAVRFSLSRYNTMEEVERLLEVLPNMVRPLAGIAA